MVWNKKKRSQALIIDAAPSATVSVRIVSAAMGKDKEDSLLHNTLVNVDLTKISIRGRRREMRGGGGYCL
jgi:hypothetical protein